MNTPCILHTGSVTNAGYGQVGRRINGKFKVFGAHRYAWEQKNGPIPDGQYVLHQCDNKLCINTDHMRLGTQFENIHEAIDRNRGVGRPSKFTDQQLAEIRERHESGQTNKEIALAFNVHYRTIGRLLRA